MITHIITGILKDISEVLVKSVHLAADLSGLRDFLKFLMGEDPE